MQRTMLAAVRATDERLIAPRYLMQISAHLIFSYVYLTVGFVKHLSPYTRCIAELMWFALSYFAHKKNNNGKLFVTGQFQCKRCHIQCL